jgi:hypothetical protein
MFDFDKPIFVIYIDQNNLDYKIMESLNESDLQIIRLPGEHYEIKTLWGGKDGNHNYIDKNEIENFVKNIKSLVIELKSIDHFDITDEDKQKFKQIIRSEKLKNILKLK